MAHWHRMLLVAAWGPGLPAIMACHDGLELSVKKSLSAAPSSAALLTYSMTHGPRDGHGHGHGHGVFILATSSKGPRHHGTSMSFLCFGQPNKPWDSCNPRPPLPG
jgi:hypothetical protein